MQRNIKVRRMGDKCFTVDTNSKEAVARKETDNTLIYILIAIGILNLLKS
jgi:hypothetical protein